MPSASHFSERLAHSAVVVANGATASGNLNLYGTAPVGLYMPAALTSTTMKFKASNDGVNFFTVKDKTGTDVSITVSAGVFIALDPLLFQGIQHLQLTMGSAEGAERSIVVASKPV